MNSRGLRGDRAELTAAREWWPRLTENDFAAIAGERDELMRRLKVRYEKTYGEIEREVTEFECREVRFAYASRRSLGIMNDS